MNRIYKIHSNIKADCMWTLPVVVEIKSFDEDGFSKFRKDFEKAHNTGQNVIPVVIDSYGGHVYSLNGMISTVESSELPVATILLSKAMSCGAVLLSCGTDGMRYISSRSTVMIHDVSSGYKGKNGEVQADAKETDRLNADIYKTMAEKCGQPKKYFDKIVHEKGHADWYLTAKDCIEHKLANHIGVPNFMVNIDLTTELVLKKG